MESIKSRLLGCVCICMAVSLLVTDIKSEFVLLSGMVFVSLAMIALDAFERKKK